MQKGVSGRTLPRWSVSPARKRLRKGECPLIPGPPGCPQTQSAALTCELTCHSRLVGQHLQDGSLKFNYGVYLSPEVNAFAMANGTIRIYSGLMDIPQLSLTTLTSSSNFLLNVVLEIPSSFAAWT